MAELSSAARKKIPAKKFGEPGNRAYPIPDQAHAANAKARATQELHKGNLSKEMHAHIVKMADTILGEGK